MARRPPAESVTQAGGRPRPPVPRSDSNPMDRTRTGAVDANRHDPQRSGQALKDHGGNPGPAQARRRKQCNCPGAPPAQHSAMPYRIPKSPRIARAIHWPMTGLGPRRRRKTGAAGPPVAPVRHGSPLIFLAIFSNMNSTGMLESINGGPSNWLPPWQPIYSPRGPIRSFPQRLRRAHSRRKTCVQAPR